MRQRFSSTVTILGTAVCSFSTRNNGTTLVFASRTNNPVISRLSAIQLATTSTVALAVAPPPTTTSTQPRFLATTSATTTTGAGGAGMVDAEYPGTAVERMLAVRSRVAQLTPVDLNGNWDDVRRRILWAGGLRDLPTNEPGQGYTGHSFNDFNHVDLTCISEQVSDNENDGSVKGIALGNRLGPGIRIASMDDQDLGGPGGGGSWSTCAIGCNKDPPRDVAHVQFQSRIAFKLVWVPNENFDTFVLVDDDGKELARGTPTGQLPALQERMLNFEIMKDSKYSQAAESIATKK